MRRTECSRVALALCWLVSLPACGGDRPPSEPRSGSVAPAAEPTPAVAGADEPPAEPLPASRARPERPGRPAAGRGAGPAGGMWWNQDEVVEALALRTEQRSAMDATFRAFLASRPELQDRQRVAWQEVTAALASGDDAAANAAIDRLGGAAAASTTAGARMMVAVLGELSSDQRQRLGERYPHLLNAPWFRMLGGPRRQAGRPAPPTDPPPPDE